MGNKMNIVVLTPAQLQTINSWITNTSVTSYLMDETNKDKLDKEFIGTIGFSATKVYRVTDNAIALIVMLVEMHSSDRPKGVHYFIHNEDGVITGTDGSTVSFQVFIDKYVR